MFFAGFVGVAFAGNTGAVTAGLVAGVWLPVAPVWASTGAADTEAAISATASFLNMTFVLPCAPVL
jgi:hypothetical protein